VEASAVDTRTRSVTTVDAPCVVVAVSVMVYVKLLADWIMVISSTDTEGVAVTVMISVIVEIGTRVGDKELWPTSALVELVSRLVI
jgi:hypothetical protein